MAILSLIGATALAGPGAATAQVTRPEFPSAAVAPEDALAYVVFTLDEDSDQWLLGSDLLDRAGIGATLEDLRNDFLTDAAGNDLPLDAFLGGEIAVVVTDRLLDTALEASSGLTGTDFGEDPAATPTDPLAVPEATGAAGILDPQAPDTAFAAIEASLDDQALESGTQVVEQDYEGVAIQYVVGSEDGTTSDMAIARLGDLILFGGSPTDLEPIIDTEQGTTPPLSEFAPFTDLRAELDEDFLLYGFFNGAVAGEAQALAGASLGSTATALGGTDRYSAFLVRADDPGFRMETVAMAAEGESLPPAADPFESALLVETPGDVLFFLNAADLGQTGFLDGLGVGLLSLFTGQLEGSVATPEPDQSAEEFVAAQFEAAAGLLGFNLQTELLQQFVGEYTLWIRSGADPSTISALFASEVGDPGAVVNALSQLTLLIQSGGGGVATVTTRQVDGSEVNVIDTGDPSQPDLEYGIVDNRFLLGLGSAIDDVVSGPNDTLADNPQFQEVMATLPAERNGLLYVDFAQIIPLLQELATASEDSIDAPDDEFAIEDASPDCGNFETAEEAQVAYDAGEEGTFDLDQDFDGEVCEDFFASAATPEAEVEPVGTPADAADAAVQADFSGIRAFALSASDDGGMRRSDSILYITTADGAADATPTP